ncbi:M12 family metallopeptidase [Salmonella sp. s54925]|uniref:M12 family metallopeptidase n=1 Tax=Salmonella sp. s54925 TaxID=3159674 RepID=UPI00397EB6BE
MNSLGVSYDYGSVMHYGSTAFARRYGLTTITSLKGRRTLGQYRGLSPSDKKQVGILYGCTTTTTTKPTKPTKPTACTDTPSHISWCTDSEKVGLCRNSLFKSYMTSHCCSKCRPAPTPNPACSDTESQANCNGWKGSGFCNPTHKYGNFMKKHCCKTCKSASKTCVDKNRNCSTWQKNGYCSTGSSVQYMKKNCAKSCGC